MTEYTLLDVSDGPKTVLSLWALGNYPNDTAGNYRAIGPITIDGTEVSVYPAGEHWSAQDTAADAIASLPCVPLRYDSSLKVEWEHNGSGNWVTVGAFILGSGPHSIAVVKDGEPVYMMAENLSEETIEGMNVPSGYKIVRNPSISHSDPMGGGMWDDDREKVVAHPYWEPFHNTLDKLEEMARGAGVQRVLDEIEKNPTAYENVFGGKLPQEDPVEEAVQFFYEREKEKMVELSELERIREGK